MPPPVTASWYLYRLLVGLLQFILANLLAALAQILARADSCHHRRPGADSGRGLGADSAVVFLLGWAALRIRRAPALAAGHAPAADGAGRAAAPAAAAPLYDTAVSLRGVPPRISPLRWGLSAFTCRDGSGRARGNPSGDCIPGARASARLQVG